MQDDVRWNGLEIGPKTPFLLEPPAELRAPREGDDTRRNPARDIDAAARAEHQRDISGKRAQQGAKHIERRAGGPATAIEGGLGDFSGMARRDLSLIQHRYRLIESLESGARYQALGRDMPETTAQMVDDRIFPLRRSRNGGMA